MRKPFVYEELKKDIISQIKSGKLKPNNRILSENELSRKYEVSLKSVRRALKELKEENVIFAHKGKGTFIADSKSNRKKKSSKILGLIVADLAISFHSEIARACEDEAHKSGYQVILGNTDNIAEKEEAYMRKFSSQGLDGAIVVTGKNSFRNKYFPHFVKTIPLVIVDTKIEGLKTDLVTTDDISGAYEAICHLISLGHRRIAHLSGPSNISTARQRIEGCRKGLMRHNVPLDESLVKETDFTEETGYQVMQRLLEGEKGITAVFAVTDTAALGAIKAIQEKGLKVPNDISIIGYGDLKIASDIPLSTVFQPAYQMGEVAAEMLFEKIKGKRGLNDIKEVVLPTRLIIRKSSANLAKVEEVTMVR